MGKFLSFFGPEEEYWADLVLSFGKADKYNDVVVVVVIVGKNPSQHGKITEIRCSVNDNREVRIIEKSS